MASGTGMLDIHQLVWDEPTLAVAGVERDQLSPIIDFDTPRVGLAPDYARRWPILAHVPWFPAIGDGACANIGGGAKRPDRLALTIGTSGAMRMVTTDVDHPLPDRLWMYRLDRDHGILGGGMSNGGNVISWLRHLLGRDYASDDWQAVGPMTPDAHGLTLLPFVAGERAPSWNAHANGVIAGLTLATEPADLLRAAMEAVAYRCALVYEQLAPFADQPHQIVAGGAAILNSPDWLQIIADVLNHELLAPDPDEEASARGAAVATLIALGEIAGFDAAPDPVVGAEIYYPDPVRHRIYQAGLARHVRLESLLFPNRGTWMT
jgi:gluconokinase